MKTDKMTNIYKMYVADYKNICATISFKLTRKQIKI